MIIELCVQNMKKYIPSIVILIVFGMFLSNKLFYPLHMDEASNFSQYLDWYNHLECMPLYYGFIGLFKFIFRKIEYIRVFILLISGINLYFLYLLAKEIKIKKPLLIISLILIVPVIMQSLIFFDENAFLNLFMTIFMYIYYKGRLCPKKMTILLLSLAFSCGLLVKLTTPFIFPIFALIMHYGYKEDFKYNTRHLLFVFLLIPLIILGGYILFNLHFESFHFLESFKYIASRGSAYDYRFIPIEIWILFLWMSPIFFVLVLDNKIHRLQKPILILCALIFLMYFVTHFIAGSYPKYLVWIIMLSSLIVFNNFINNHKWKADHIFVFLLFFSFHILIVRDPLLFMSPLTGASFFYKEFVNQFIFLSWIKLLPAGIVLLLCMYLKKPKILFIYFVTFCLSTSIYQANAKYSTIYAYGEKGLSEVLHKCNSLIKKDDIVYAVKDIDYVLDKYNKTADAYVEHQDDYLANIETISPNYFIIRDYWVQGNWPAELTNYSIVYYKSNFVIFSRL